MKVHCVLYSCFELHQKVRVRDVLTVHGAVDEYVSQGGMGAVFC